MESKNFDAVQFMRQVRDRMGSDMQGMSFEEQKAYIEQRASKVRSELKLEDETAVSGRLETRK
jgi:hypothetical protein